MPRSIPYYSVLTWILLSSAISPNDRFISLDFVVLKGSERLGTITISQQIDANRITYILRSDVNVDFIFSLNILEKITDVFENGTLSSSTHQRYINGVLKSSNSLSKHGNEYLVVSSNDKVKRLNDYIPTSVLSLYFNEPGSDGWIYSQNHRQLVRLRKTSDHHYCIDLPQGGVTCYTYQNGKLNKVESKTPLGMVKFVSIH